MRPLLPLAAIPLGLAEGFALTLPTPGLLAAHVAVAVLTWGLWRHASSPLVALRAFTLSLCFPAIGPMAAWLIHPSRPEERGTLLERYQAMIAYQPEKGEAPTIRDADEALRQELSVVPFIDALRHGDLFAKQAAISAISLAEEGAGILRSTLTHHDGDTRLFGSLALLRLEESHMEALSQARDGVATSADPTSLQQLQTALLRYLDSGLPDGKVALELWRELQQTARQAVQLDMNPALSLARLAQACCELGELEGAREASEQLSSLHLTEEEALLRWCHALYALGDLERLRKVADTLAEVAIPSSPAHQVAVFWRGDGTL